jgi:hypothetical protein
VQFPLNQFSPGLVYSRDLRAEKRSTCTRMLSNVRQTRRMVSGPGANSDRAVFFREE